MIFKTKSIFHYLLFTILMVSGLQMSAQIAMRPPEPAGGASAWTKICAGLDTGSGPFNSYDMTISWAGSLPNPGNEFVLELSDANGNFSTPVELARVSDQNTNTAKEFDINFAVPTTVSGTGYKFRARSTDNVSDAESDSSYHIYYMSVTTNLNISELGDGNPPGSICSQTPVNLQVDNISNPENFQYQWYRSGTLLPSETGHTISAATSGMYQALIDYGDCTFSGNTDSNFVTITISGSGTGVSIITPSQTALCAGQTETLMVDMPDGTASYQWFKDNNLITGATTTSYVVDGNIAGFEGDYTVEMSGSGICTEMSDAVTMTVAGGFTVTRDNPASLVILPSLTETLSVSTTANSPTYQWYRNGSPVTSATNSTLAITQDGTYYAEVSSSGACSATQNSENTIAVVPSSFEINIDFNADYLACTSTSNILSIENINAIDSNGNSTDVTTQLENSFTYQWTLNGTNISGATGQSISIADSSENGNYILNGVLTSYTPNSNTLNVQLLTSETITINSTSTIYCNDTDLITLSTSTDLSTEVFAWERNGTAINTTDSTIEVNQPGAYRLSVDKDGCSLISNEITIAPLDPDLINLDVEGDIIFPEGSSKTVTASGGTAYKWYDSNNTLLNSTESMTFTEEGSFLLVASIDNCQISKPLNVVYLDVFKVPNVITPNADGSNDQWVIPNSYSNNSNVNVIIYDEKGREVLNEMGYQNNWPQSSFSFAKQNMVFYYVIKNETETLKKGTITVIR